MPPPCPAAATWISKPSAKSTNEPCRYRRGSFAFRAHDFVPSVGGEDEYANRYMEVVELRWGKILRWEVYEDTERVAAWDRRRHAVAS